MPAYVSNNNAQQPTEIFGRKDVHSVFSTQEIRKVGTGTTTRKSVHKTFWFVEQHGDEIICQPLNINYVPSGPKRKITMEELLSKFSPEPEFYMSSVFPKMRELDETVKKGDEHREKGESFTAEFEYNRALKVDEENVRANFGIGLTYLERGDEAKAKDIFERLVKLDGAFDAEHKHLFNEFGISMRKNKMLKQSVAYYQRALQLTHDDENLYMNMARVLLDTKDMKGCVENLLKALKISPRHDASVKFLMWLIRKKLVPTNFQDAVRDALQTAKNTTSKSTPTPVAPPPPSSAPVSTVDLDLPAMSEEEAPTAQVKTEASTPQPPDIPDFLRQAKNS